MAEYLLEVEHAATSVLDAAWVEHRRIRELQDERVRVFDKHLEEYLAKHPRPSRLRSKEQDLADLIEHTNKAFPPLEEETMRAAEERLRSRRFSMDSLAGSVLQFAKQGLSIVHGGLASCPPGRLVGSQPVKHVIWHARNQSIHWENNVFHEATTECFERLARELGPNFADFRTRSMAFDILLLLGWVDFEHLSQDLKHLG